MAAQLPPSSRLEALCNVRVAVNILRVRLATTVNEAALVNQLPDNILLNILGHAESETFVAAAESCRRWMDLANQAALIPSEILIVSDECLRDRVPRLLAIFETMPLSFEIHVKNSCEVLGGFLREHLHHIRSLKLMVFFDFSVVDKEPLVAPLVYALGTAAPLLQTVDIYIERSYWLNPAETYLPDGLFANSAPLLRSTKFDGINARLCPYAALSSARILDLKQPEINLVRLLDFYPQLKQLRAHTPLLVSGRRKINPHNLHLLELRGTVAAVDAVLHRLVLTRPLSVWMDRVEDVVLGHILSTKPRSHIRRVQFCVEYGTENYGCILGFSGGPTWYLIFGPSVAAGKHIFPYEEAMANIVDLSFHELYWPDCPREAIPPASRLERLELVLDSYSAPSTGVYMRQYVENMSTLFYEGRAFVLRCPVLEEICISAPAKLISLAIDIYDVCEFIRRNLDFGTAFPRLVLRNIQFYDPALGQGMQLLTTLVSDITYLPAFVPNIPKLHQNGDKTWMYSMMG